MQLAARHDLIVPDIGARQRLAVELDGPYVTVGVRQVVDDNAELLAVWNGAGLEFLDVCVTVCAIFLP
jgi:hypothetical protein